MGFAIWVAMAFVAAGGSSDETPPGPIGNPGEWITTDDYPAAALAAGASGVTEVKMEVSPEGTVVDCSVLSSSGAISLDETACNRLKERARYEPGKNKAGKRITSLVTQRIRWQLPPNQRPKLFPTAVTMRFELTENGTIEGCEVLTLLPAAMEGYVFPCMTLPKVGFEPIRDKAGTPVRRTVVMRNEVEIREQ